MKAGRFRAPVGALLALALAAVAGRDLGPALIANLGAIALARTDACGTVPLPCTPAGRAVQPVGGAARPETVAAAQTWLAAAAQVAPWQADIRLRLAEADLAAGQGAAAAALLPAQPVPAAAAGPRLPAAPSRLLQPGSYANALLAGYQAAARQDWAGAVAAFRVALALNGPALSLADHQALYAALAQQAAKQSAAAHADIEAGRAFAWAGQWAAAAHWLQQAQQAADWSALPPAEQASAWFYLGRAREAMGDSGGAPAAYQAAISLDAAATLPRLWALRLLRQQQGRAADVPADALLAHGPTYPVSGDALGNGWRLVGYEVDPHQLEAGSLLDLWLWWRGPAGATPRGMGWLAVGGYWLQPRSAVNLAPNGGFEWGSTADGLPVGVFPMWDVRAGNARVEQASGPTGTTHLLRLDQVTGTAAVRSGPIAVAVGAPYLAGFWLRQSAEGRLELRCHEGAGPVFVVSGQPGPGWRHLAAAGPAYPDPLTQTCVVAEMAGGATEWDQVVVVPLDPLP